MYEVQASWSTYSNEFTVNTRLALVLASTYPYALRVMTSQLLRQALMQQVSQLQHLLQLTSC